MRLKAPNGSSQKSLRCRSAHIVPVVLDADLAVASMGGAGASILSLPLGTSSLLIELLDRLSERGFQRPLVVTTRGAGRFDGAVVNGHAGTFRPVPAARLASMVSASEASDYVLLVQTRYWPANCHAFDSVGDSRLVFPGATHAVALAAGADGAVADERLVCATDGRVRRVQRLYDTMNWAEAAASMMIYSLVPVHVLAGEDLCDLAGLRRALAARGVLTQDVPWMTEVYDLREPTNILALSERTITARLRRPPAAGYRLSAQGAWVGEKCRIHPSVQLSGPIMVQPGVIIDEGARIIGPTLLGAGARVGKGATVMGSVLGFGASVAAGAAVVRQVLLANGAEVVGASTATAHPADPDQAFAWRASSQGSPQTRAPSLPTRWRRVQSSVKRAVDFSAAIVALMLLAPLLAVVALLIKVTSPGPVFFVHRREGQGGREFPCLKFRSMVADAHLQQRELYGHNLVDGPQFKMACDPRETRVGRWLRRTNLDELPQLFNVLVGQMSLVGPRPSPFRENQICVSWRQARLSVRPGITGLWQLCRDRRAEGDFHQWIHYDLAYVSNCSLRLDLLILLHTVLSLGGRRRVAMSRLIPDKAARAVSMAQV